MYQQFDLYNKTTIYVSFKMFIKSKTIERKNFIARFKIHLNLHTFCF